MTKKEIMIWVVAAMLAGCVAAAALFGFITQMNRKTGAQLEAMKATPAPVPTVTVPPTPKPVPATPEPTPTPEPYISPVNFDELHELNPDIYAWINIPDMNVDYPVLQHPTEDNFYLDYTVEKWLGYPGSIYTQTISAKDFSDYNTVIYGHNMKNGDMFGRLRDYRSPEFLQNHREIFIYTPEAGFVYKIFAAVIYTDDLIPKTFDFNTAEGREDFLASLNKLERPESQILDDVEVTADDRLLTLSTCIDGEGDHRYLIIGVLEKDK